jgi:hypothetical protein
MMIDVPSHLLAGNLFYLSALTIAVFAVVALSCSPPGFRLCGMTLLNGGVVARLGAVGTVAITLGKYATKLLQVDTRVLLPIVDVQQQLITPCIIN